MRRAALVLIPFLLAVVLFAPATVGGKVLSAGDLPLFWPPYPPQPAGAEPQNQLQFDAAYVFEPDGLQVRRALRDGRLPVWTSALSAGRPLLAAQQSAPLFPLTWIGVVFPYFGSLAWIAVLKLTLAALGTALLARALGLGRGPALLAAVAFGFGSYLVDWLSHPHANAYVLLPWLFLLAERLCQRGRVRDAGALGLALGIAYLGGQPESSLIVSLAAAAWLAHRLVAVDLPRREALRRAGLAVAATLLGVALAAVMLVPFVEALRESSNTSRAQPPLSLRAVGSLFFPEISGRPDRAHLPGLVNFTERTIYVGVVPLLLAGAGLVARRPRGPQLFFAGMTAVALVVALDTGPVTDLIRDLPLLDSVNVNRVLVLASFAIAMLAAFGCELFLSGTAAERRRMLIAAAVAGLLPALAVLAARPGRLDDLGHGVERLLGFDAPLNADVLALASVLRWLGLAVVVLALLAALTRWRSVVIGLVALAALDLLVMGWGYNPAITKSEAEPPAPAPVEVMRRLTDTGGRVVGIDGLEPNTASRWGLEDARGHELPGVERTLGLWYALGGGSSPATEAVRPADRRTPLLLDVFGVRAALVYRRRPALGRVAYSGPGGVVEYRRSALPPAFVAYGWRRSASLDGALFRMRAGSSRQARDEPVIETPAGSPAGSPGAATQARVVSRSDTEVKLDVTARRRGQLVLLDTYYPGWHAEVDGRETPIHPANVAFRAVAVSAGSHRVRFSYRPGSVLAGGVISLVALALLAAGLAFGGRRRA